MNPFSSSLQRLNFQQRLVLGITGLMLITTLSLGIAGSQLSKNFLLIRFKDRMEFLAKYLAANCELGILLGDKDMLQRLASNLLKEEDVVEVTITDREGHILAKASTTPRESMNLYKAKARVILSTTSENLAFSRGETHQKTIGHVSIAYVTTSINGLTSQLQFRYFILTLLISSAGILFFWIFTKSLTAPLERLIEAAQKVAQGDLEVKLEEGSLPETKKLAQAFNTMTEALKQSRRDLEETYQKLIQEKSLAEVGHFAVTVAHEVKNPLGIIKGALDILKKSEIDQQLRSTMISYVEDEIQRLNLLIRDFLEFSRPKPLTFQEIDLKLLLEEIVRRTQLEWEAKGISVRLLAKIQKAPIQADPQALSRAMLNIIKNGCEASPEGEEVTVELEESGPLSYSIIIRDHGEGIKAEPKERIFEPFFTTKSKGTGLGLTLTKKIIEAHMGQITVRDNHPKGTIVEITIGK